MTAPLLLVGTYTTGHSALGIYLCGFDGDGSLRVRDVCAATDPSFVVRHPRLPVAYAVNELPNGYGSVSVLAIDAVQQRIQMRQQTTSGGEAPCHVAIATDGSGMFVAHYGCGTVRWLGLDIQGQLTGETHAVQHAGSSVRRRQASAHPHCVVLRASPSRGDDMYVTDLGQDCIVHYVLEPTRGLIERSRCVLHAGAGPRHLCFLPDGLVAFVGNELDNTVSTLTVGADGDLTELRWRSSLPEDGAPRSAIGEIALHPSGRWLYVSNRGIDAITWFSVGAGGALQWGGMVPSQGQHPRHFLVTPDGLRLIVANRDADNLVLFSIDQDTGAPLAPGAICHEVPAPVCICWL